LSPLTYVTEVKQNPLRALLWSVILYDESKSVESAVNIYGGE